MLKEKVQLAWCPLQGPRPLTSGGTSEAFRSDYDSENLLGGPTCYFFKGELKSLFPHENPLKIEGNSSTSFLPESHCYSSKVRAMCC